MNKAAILRSASWTATILLAAALAFSVFVFGATLPWIIRGARFLLLLATLAGLVELILTGSWRQLLSPRILFVWLPALLLIGLGYLLAHNAVFDHSRLTWEFTPLAPPWPALPGGVTQRASTFAFWTQSGLLVACWMLAVRLKDDRILLRTVQTLAVIALVFACLGIFQKALGFKAMYGMPDARHGMFFGSYRSHNNAGSFFLMMTPLVAALALREKPEASGVNRMGLFWGGALLLMIIGWLMTPSRAGFVIGLGTFGLFFLLNRRRIRARLEGREKRPGERRVLAILIAGIALLGLLVGLAQIGPRWLEFFSSEYWPLTNTSRWKVYTVCVDIIKESGWFGMGPGCFVHVFPYYTHHLGDALKGQWFNAHQDYLEWTIEWGFVGVACWLLLCWGGYAVCAWALFKRKRRLSRDRVLLLRAAFVSMTGVFLHAMVDFPLHIYSLQLIALVVVAMAWSTVFGWGKEPE